MRRQLPTIIAALILVVVLVLYMITYEVRSTEVAIVKTFGRADEKNVIRQAGFGWKWPPPIQRVVKYDQRIHVLQDTFEETATRDQKNIVVMTFCAWRIENPLRFHKSVKPDTMDEAEQRIKDLMRSHKNDIIGQYDFGNFVSTDKAELRFDEIESKLLARVQKDALDKYGIEVIALGIQRLTLPQSITERVFERMRKTREKIASDYRSEGEAEAAKITSEAKKIESEILAFARRRADNIRAEGERLASEYYKGFEEDEDFAIFLRALDFIEKTITKHTTLLLDSSPFDLFQTGPAGYTFPERPGMPTVIDEPAKDKTQETAATNAQ